MRPSKDLWVWPDIDELYIINPSMIVDICDCPLLVGFLRAARYISLGPIPDDRLKNS